MSEILLSGRERIELEHLVAHANDARLVQRAYALLWLDDGESIAEVAQRLGVTRQSVYNWTAHWSDRTARQISVRLADAPRSGRPATAHGVIDPLIDQVVDGDPRSFGYRPNLWTASLLAHYLREKHQLAVSADSVHLAIARLRVAWKRPRHDLALREPSWRQAKGGLKRGSESGSEVSS
jgi:transposase